MKIMENGNIGIKEKLYDALTFHETWKFVPEGKKRGKKFNMMGFYGAEKYRYHESEYHEMLKIAEDKACIILNPKFNSLVESLEGGALLFTFNYNNGENYYTHILQPTLLKNDDQWAKCF